MNYDVVIIGAGPSGIAAGHNIINNKLSCCIIDKQVFPRNKLCAGGVTQKTFELLKSLNLGQEFKGENTIISKSVSIYLKDKYITDIECKVIILFSVSIFFILVFSNNFPPFFS